jgi:glycosyltransferase involved in cell wall biosynthesis
MKIGFDFRMGGSINAGIGRYSFELLKQLLDLKQDDYVVFYNPENVNQVDLKVIEEKGGKLVTAPFRHYSFGEQVKFPKLLNQFNLDLVHFPNFNVPVFYKGDFVTTIHDMVHHKISGHKKSRYWKFLAYKYVMNFAAQKSKAIFTVTESSKKEIVDYLNIDPDKIIVTHLAPDRYEGAITSIETLKERYLLRRPYLLFLGALERKKNVLGLVRGFDAFLKKYKYDMDLVLIGRVDPYYPEVKQQCLEIAHKDNLVFTGFVSNADQTAFYQNAFAFITASLHEGFGLPALEAMQYGIPVLATNSEVFNEVYDNAAIYFDAENPDDIADKINLLVSDQPFYESMQEKSVKRSNLFDWKLTAEKTNQAYHEVKQQIFNPEPEIE